MKENIDVMVQFSAMCYLEIGERNRIVFWEDNLIGDGCLSRKFPKIFNIA